MLGSVSTCGKKLPEIKERANYNRIREAINNSSIYFNINYYYSIDNRIYQMAK